MDIKFFYKKFLDIISAINNEDLIFYQFGSSSSNEKIFNDIDILIIYNNYEEMNIIKLKLIEELKEWLPHITCLSTVEEFELSFIKAVDAKKLYPN